MIQVNENKEITSVDNIDVADTDGNIIEVAYLYGCIKSNGSVSYLFEIRNEELYHLNQVAIQEHITQFIAELNAEALRLNALTI